MKGWHELSFQRNSRPFFSLKPKKQGTWLVFFKKQGTSLIFLKKQGTSLIFLKKQGTSLVFFKKHGTSLIFAKLVSLLILVACGAPIHAGTWDVLLHHVDYDERSGLHCWNFVATFQQFPGGEAWNGFAEIYSKVTWMVHPVQFIRDLFRRAWVDHFSTVTWMVSLWDETR